MPDQPRPFVWHCKPRRRRSSCGRRRPPSTSASGCSARAPHRSAASCMLVALGTLSLSVWGQSAPLPVLIPGSHLRGVVAHAPGTGTMAQVRRRRYPLAPSTVHCARRRCTTPPASICTAVGAFAGLLRRRSHGGQGEWATVDEAAAVDLEVGTGPCSSCPLPDCFPRWAYVAPVLLKRAPY